MYYRLLSVFFVMIFFISGCSQYGEVKPRIIQPYTPALLKSHLPQFQPKSLTADAEIAFPELLSQLAPAKAVFVGEVHDRYDHHLVQLKLLQSLHQKNPNIAIGLEWFQQPYQWVLNAYLNGKFSEAQLLKKSEYKRRWQYNFALLRPILQYARQHKIPMIALSAPMELTRKIGKQGLASLSAAQRERLPVVIHPASKAYHKKLSAVFLEHSQNKKLLENFIMVQRVWDETMAMNIAKFLQKHPKHTMLVFAGRGHMSEGTGIPTDLARSSPDKIVVLAAGEKSERLKSVDYFVLTEALKLIKKKPKTKNVKAKKSTGLKSVDK
jgi:uncharacterized iron-regulated protein